MTARAPDLRPARVTVTLTDGRQETRMRDSHRGDFRDPFDAAEIRTKFRQLAGVVLPAEGAAAAERAIDACESWPDIGALTGVLRRWGQG